MWARLESCGRCCSWTCVPTKVKGVAKRSAKLMLVVEEVGNANHHKKGDILYIFNGLLATVVCYKVAVFEWFDSQVL